MNAPAPAQTMTLSLAERNVPSLIVLSVMGFSLGALLFWQAMALVDLRFVLYLSPCYDFGVFYNAAMAIRQGLSPYEGTGFVFPPLTGRLIVPLSYLNKQTLIALLPLSTLAALVSGLAILSRAFDARLFRRASLGESLLVLLGICLILGLSYPFIFLSNRGNIDGYVLLLLCAGVALLRKDSIWPASFFALAVMCKVYPALSALLLLVYVRWRLALAFRIFLLGLAALTVGDWKGFSRRRPRGGPWFSSLRKTGV